jgi:hypothetical protein
MHTYLDTRPTLAQNTCIGSDSQTHYNHPSTHLALQPIFLARLNYGDNTLICSILSHVLEMDEKFNYLSRDNSNFFRQITK